MLVKYLISLIY